MTTPDFFKSRTWFEFEKFCSDLSGIFVQAFPYAEEIAVPISSKPALCSYLCRHKETHRTCLKGCFQALAEQGRGSSIIPGRCYAGLSYRIVPVMADGRPVIRLLVGKVYTKISGADQMLAILDRYHVDKEDYRQYVTGIRYIPEKELDWSALFLRRFALELFEMNTKARESRDLRSLYKKSIALIGRLAGLPTGDSRNYQKILELLQPLFDTEGAAFYLSNGDDDDGSIVATVGPEGGWLSNLSGRGLGGLIGERDIDEVFTISGPQELKDLGLPPSLGPLVICPLCYSKKNIGCLLMLGMEISGAYAEILRMCSQALSLQVYNAMNSQLWEKRGREIAVFNEIGREIFLFEKVEDILNRALEAVMSGLKAGRGSIFLVDEEMNTVSDAVMRGAHAELAGKIKSFSSGSITEKVISDSRPLLVRDIRKEMSRKRKKRFPYDGNSFISVPIRDNGNTVGVIHLTERQEDDAFTEWDLSLLDRVGFQTAVAIHKARLQKEVDNLRELSFTDPLTNIPNRRYLEECLDIEFQRANRFVHPLSLAMIDIDHFKQYNEALGYEKGDRILIEIIKTIKKSVRLIDTFARYGGDEFVLLLLETDLRGAITIAEKIRSGVEAKRFPYEDLSRRKKLTVSIGISTFPDMAMTTRELTNRANQALLEAKRVGKNVVIPWTK